MTDNFYVRVGPVDGARVTFDVMSTGNGLYLDDVKSSRSFGLLLVRDSLRDKMLTEARWPTSRSPLLVLLDEAAREEPDWFVSEPWMRAHVARFVERIELVAEPSRKVKDLEERFDHVARRWAGRRRPDDRGLSNDERNENEARLQRERLDELWQVGHGFVLDVTVKDARWLAELDGKRGQWFGTTAYDVWDESDAP